MSPAFSCCPFLSIRCSSIPAIVASAESNDLNPSVDFVIRLIPRWFCSTRLFRYFIRLTSISKGESPQRNNRLLMRSSAAVLSMLTFSGNPLKLMACLKNFSTAARSRVPLHGHQNESFRKVVTFETEHHSTLTRIYCSTV